MRTHEQCGAKGYSSIKPLNAITLGKVQPGELHTLRAELRGDDLTLIADGAPAWAGQVQVGTADFDGPVGLRTEPTSGNSMLAKVRQERSDAQIYCSWKVGRMFTVAVVCCVPPCRSRQVRV